VESFPSSLPADMRLREYSLDDSLVSQSAERAICVVVGGGAWRSCFFLGLLKRLQETISADELRQWAFTGESAYAEFDSNSCGQKHVNLSRTPMRVSVACSWLSGFQSHWWQWDLFRRRAGYRPAVAETGSHGDHDGTGRAAAPARSSRSLLKHCWGVHMCCPGLRI
jgi:hypothetical protein